tara:strand:+ start:105 stop:494 length:390 start_codon:yes stop_codon:yes gene_type:complete
MELKTIGSVGVDSGQLFISDPCYIKHTEQGNGEWNADLVEQKDGSKKWISKNDPTLESKQNFYTKVCEANRNGQGEVELGVAFGTTHGDGTYKVEGIYDEDGIMVGIFMDLDGRIKADFKYDDEEEEWY